MLPASELPHTPLPGGGFDTGSWTVWCNVYHPIPSPYINDIEFGSDSVIWLASDGGLTRFDRNGATPQAMWFTYNAANSPLTHWQISAPEFDADGYLWASAMSEGVVQLLIGPTPAIPGDIDGDGDVDGDDAQHLASVLLGQDVATDHMNRADVNGDGVADGADIESFVAVLMAC